MNSEEVIIKYLMELYKYDTTAFHSYSTLKKNVQDEKILNILSEIAEDEKKHIQILEDLIQKTQARIKKSDQ